uniref:Uncharacterized protein n=1 Tax=Parascaris univalens TaxID=6257 RepID=A0A915BMT2_PARUN
MCSDGLLVGSQLLSIVASPTQKEIPVLKTQVRNLNADVRLRWCDVHDEMTFMSNSNR